MKYIFLLLLIAACSTTDKKSEKAATPVTGTPTESEAKPVSPYTVKPCFCMKIFKPVCAGGRNFGNSCEAECNGHTTWTEGNCAKQ